jgi:hypothetical protein
VQELILRYENTTSKEKVTARIISYPKVKMIQVDILLDGIPLTKNGSEVIVQFYAYTFDNNKTFFTDSNGLKMEERYLNSRPDFDFSTTQNISANYYPVNSAIVIKDTLQQL